MKLIIAGGRDYRFTMDDKKRLADLHEQYNVEEVVSGHATGADMEGEMWAKYMRIPARLFPADWNAHGRAAGPIRNRQMAEYANAVALFPGGRGTDNMFQEATKAGLLIFDFRVVALNS